jgi:hypothetical protein
MESHAFQNLPQKRIKKLASRFSDEEVRASLVEDEDNRAFILESGDFAQVMNWNAFSGAMAVADDDEVRAFAQLQFLKRNGYPSFKSIDEVERYATIAGWPRKDRHSRQ